MLFGYFHRYNPTTYTFLNARHIAEIKFPPFSEYKYPLQWSPVQTESNTYATTGKCFEYV